GLRLGQVLQELVDRLDVDPRQWRLQLAQTLRVHRVRDAPEIEIPGFQSLQLGFAGNLREIAMEDFDADDRYFAQALYLCAAEVENLEGLARQRGQIGDRNPVKVQVRQRHLPDNLDAGNLREGQVQMSQRQAPQRRNVGQFPLFPWRRRRAAIQGNQPFQ